jgi:hypothetical protein
MGRACPRGVSGADLAEIDEPALNILDDSPGPGMRCAGHESAPGDDRPTGRAVAAAELPPVCAEPASWGAG